MRISKYRILMTWHPEGNIIGVGERESARVSVSALVIYLGKRETYRNCIDLKKNLKVLINIVSDLGPIARKAYENAKKYDTKK